MVYDNFFAEKKSVTLIWSKISIFLVFDNSVTDRWTDGPSDQWTDGWMDSPSYRDGGRMIKLNYIINLYSYLGIWFGRRKQV